MAQGKGVLNPGGKGRQRSPSVLWSAKAVLLVTTIAVCLLSGACSRSAQEETTEEAAGSVETLKVFQATGTAQPDVHGPDSIGPCLDYTKPKHIVWPEYPEGWRIYPPDPRVVVRALVDTHGFVVQAEIVKSLHPLLDELAIEAVKKWEFTPPKQGDRPIKCYVSVPVEFRLREE